MQSYKEQQGEIRKPSLVINAKKQRKTIEWKHQRSLQENQRYQGTFHAKMGTVKDRNGMDLTEAGEEINRADYSFERLSLYGK